jgi:hypothetical protein
MVATHEARMSDAAHTLHYATKQARMVLADCEASLLELRTASQDTLKRRWVATLALLRAVGNVLDRVDGHASETARTVISEARAELARPESKIFKEFIKKERDFVVKEYRFAVRGNHQIHMPPPGGGVPQPGGVALPGGLGTITDPLGTQYGTSTFALRPLTDGAFAGREPIDVVQEAIAFWHTYLDEIDKRVAALEKEP